MKCEDVERSLDDREDGLLSPEDERALEEHLESCEVCRDLVVELDAVGDEVCRLVEALPIRSTFAQEVMEGVSRSAHRRGRRGMALVGASWLAAAAAALLVFASLRTPDTVRVTETEGGILRLDASAEGWRGISPGERLEPGDWVLTFPDRRSRLDMAGGSLLLEGDVLAGLSSRRVELMHGRLLFETGDRTVRVVTPFGMIECRNATVAASIRYVRDPVFRVEAGGRPRRTRSLLALASVSLPEEESRVDLPDGFVTFAVVKGHASWWAGGRRGRLGPGRSVRLVSRGPAAPSAPRQPRVWRDRPLAAVSEEDRELARAEDPVALLAHALSSPAVLGRRLAAERLGRLCGGARVIDAVAGRLAREDDALVRRSLLDALRRLDATDRAEDVLPCLRDARPEVREAALRCWLDLRGVEGIPEVGAMIDDPEPSLRVLALRGLRALGDSAGRPWAEKALQDDDPAVSDEARRVLETLDG